MHAKTAGGDNRIRSGLMGLLYAKIIDPLPAFQIHKVVSAAGPTTVPVGSIGLHIDKFTPTLLNDPTRLFIITLAEMPLQFPAVFT